MAETANRDTIISLDTMYPSSDPEHLAARERPEDFSPAEYRQLVIKRRVNERGVSFILNVNQGWWDEVGKEPKHARSLLDMPCATEEELQAAYKVQREALIKQGYIYDWRPTNPFTDDPTENRIKFRVLKPGDTAIES